MKTSKASLTQTRKEAGAKGGAAGTGAAKRRPRAHYVKIGKASAAARALKKAAAQALKKARAILREKRP